jgi:hypothetical protein
MSWPALRDDLLYVMVFGPGFGEAVVLRIPGEHWVLIASCLIERECPSLQLLDLAGADWSYALLTHPHFDHIRGFDRILDRRRAGVVGCADPRVEDWRDWFDLLDAEELLDLSLLEQVMAAIHTIWSSDADTRWLLRRGDSKPVGIARITVLHPDVALASRRPHPGPNRLSAAMLVEWEQVRVLLGADVEQAEWDTIAGVYADLGTHHALKIPHHGSRGAVHPSYATGSRDRFWIVTPWNRKRGLPRFEAGQGVHLLLQSISRLRLTGLPVAYESQGAVPAEATRAALYAGQLPAAAPVPVAAGRTAQPIKFTAEPLACHVLVGFDRTGQIQDERYGPGSVVVRE